MKARFDEAFAVLRRQPPTAAEDLAACGHDIRAGLQKRDDVIDVEHPRHVQDAIHPKRLDVRRVGRRGHADVALPAERSGIGAGLRRVVDEHSRQLEVG